MSLPTPYYQRGPVTLFHGDCLELLPHLREESIDAVVTDPPYSSGGAFRGDRAGKSINKYVRSESHAKYTDFGGDSRDQRSFLAWCSLWMSAARMASSPGAVLCCFSDWRQLPVMTDCVQSGGWVWRNLATWWKPGCRMQRGRFSSSAEFVVYATNGAHDSDGENSPQNVFSFATMQTDDKEHIAEKPVEVLDWVMGVTRPDSLVLDPFVGSGTTAISCIRAGRRIIGIEIDEKYCEVSAKRVDRELDQKRIQFGEQNRTETQRALFAEVTT